MIDSHAHIHDPKFDADREAVLLHAREAGVEYILTIGTSVEESRDAIQVAKKYPDLVRAAVAVHPHEYSKLPDEQTRAGWKEAILEMAREECVMGVGECGLDYHAFGGVGVTQEQRECQQAGFRDHMDIAREVGKPLIVHARESYDHIKDEIEKELQFFVKDMSLRGGVRDDEAIPNLVPRSPRSRGLNFAMTQAGKKYSDGHVKRKETVHAQHTGIPYIILHCYQGDLEVTKKFLELSENIMFSFAGNVTYPIKKHLRGTKDDPREVLALIPIDRMLVETDCPYLAPQAHRGNRNEPAFVVETARFVSDLKGISYEMFDQEMTENMKHVFDA